jgi:hypothetical protein
MRPMAEGRENSRACEFAARFDWTEVGEGARERQFVDLFMLASRHRLKRHVGE